MMAHKRSILCVLALVGVLVVGLAGCRKEEGGLGGRVTSGPLAPVAQAGAAEPTADPAVYAARQVVVFDAKSGAVTAASSSCQRSADCARYSCSPGVGVTNQANSR